jgi:DNA-binding IclR family transcriptional regulator
MVEHAIKILEAFAGTEQELSLKDLSTLTKVGTTSTFRILFTLAHHNFVFKNAETGKYRLGPGMLQATWRPSANKLSEYASPYLNQLHERFNETVNLAALEGKKITYLDIRESSRIFRMTASIGVDLPIHATALGKTIGAWLSKDQLEDALRECDWTRFTRHTITSRTKWLAGLSKIRKQGYAVDKEETELGAVCVAAPILDRSKHVVGGLSISGPAPRILASQTLIVADLKKAADDIGLWV